VIIHHPLKWQLNLGPLNGMLKQHHLRGIFLVFILPAYTMAGYKELAALLGSCPELTIFRKFGTLSATVLLEMQAELMRLEEDLDILSNIKPEAEKLKPLCKTTAHKACCDNADNAADMRREKAAEAQKKLDQYCPWP